MTLLFLGNIKGWEWLIIVVAVLLLFKVNQIPKLMRNVGKGIHGFRQGLEEAKAEMNKPLETNASEEESLKDSPAPKDSDRPADA